MHPNDIQAGKTYVGKGRWPRRVDSVSGANVLYHRISKSGAERWPAGFCYLTTFAAWALAEKPTDPEGA